MSSGNSPPIRQDWRHDAIRSEYPTAPDIEILARKLGLTVKTLRNYAQRLGVSRLHVATSQALSVALSGEREPARQDTSGIVGTALAARPAVQCVIQQWGEV